MTQFDEYDSFVDSRKDKKHQMNTSRSEFSSFLTSNTTEDTKPVCVADDHLADISADGIHSGVYSLILMLRIMLFLAELNKLDVCATDIGNEYLEAKTSENVYIIAGPEFGEKEGSSVLFVINVLYRLRSFGTR